MTTPTLPGRDEPKQVTAGDRVLGAARQYAKALVKYGQAGGMLQKLAVKENMKRLKKEILNALDEKREEGALTAQEYCNGHDNSERDDDCFGCRISTKIRETPL